MQMNRFHRSLLFTVAKLPLFSMLLACQPIADAPKDQSAPTAIPAAETSTELKPLPATEAPVFLLKKPAETFAVPSRNENNNATFKTIQRRGEEGFHTIKKPGFMPLKP